MNLNENILRIKEVMGLLNEERKGKKVKIYLNGGGSDNAEEYRGSVSSILVSDTIPNEPFKDEKYLKKSENVKNMIKMIDDGEKLPPIKVIKHPNNSSKYVVIDGNHRRYAFSKSSKKEIDAIIIPHEDVLLMKNKWGEKPESYINLPDVIKDKKIVNKYFVKPNGDNDFETDKKEIDEGNNIENKSAVIEILGPLAYMDGKYRFQVVPYSKTKEDKIYIKKGSSGAKTISTKNIKVHRVFSDSEEDNIKDYVDELKSKNKSKEIDESEITEKCWSGYEKKGMKTMYGKKYPNCVKK